MELTKDQQKSRSNRFVYDDGELEQVDEQKPKTGQKFFVSQKENSDVLIIRRRMEDVDGDIIGDAINEVKPGQSALGMSYDELFNNLGEVII